MEIGGAIALGLMEWAWALLLIIFARHCRLHRREARGREPRDLYGDWSKY